MREQRIYGYARVSTKEQYEDRQVVALKKFGVAERLIYVEKQSGKDFNRPVYLRLINRLKEGDTLVIKSIDRLGRNYAEILEQWRVLTRDNGRLGAFVAEANPYKDEKGSLWYKLYSCYISANYVETYPISAETEELIRLSGANTTGRRMSWDECRENNCIFTTAHPASLFL